MVRQLLGPVEPNTSSSIVVPMTYTANVAASSTYSAGDFVNQ